MMRKAILVPLFVLTILLLTSYIFTAIGDDAESENYLLSLWASNGANTLFVANSAGASSVIYQFATGSYTQEMAIDSSGNYIIPEGGTSVLSKVTPAGVRTVIYTFPGGTWPSGLAIDSSGNYIVTEYYANKLSKITPTGERTVICSFPEGSGPNTVAIDSSGNYIVTETDHNILSKITPTGERTVIYDFSAGSALTMMRIDSSGNYIVLEDGADVFSKVTPTGERTVIYEFTRGTGLASVVIDSSGNYIIAEGNSGVLSKVTPDGVRTVIYTFPAGSNLWDVLISTTKAPELFFADITENGLTVTWTQSADPFFTGYQIYQSSAQGDLGSLIGTNTDIADTSLVVTGLSPGTTYYFTLRVLGTGGLNVNSGQRSTVTAKAFWQEIWFTQFVFVAVVVGAVAIIGSILYSRSKKKAQVT